MQRLFYGLCLLFAMLPALSWAQQQAELSPQESLFVCEGQLDSARTALIGAQQSTGRYGLQLGRAQITIEQLRKQLEAMQKDKDKPAPKADEPTANGEPKP